MWELANQTPYAADRTWVQDKDGVKHWVVVVRATFDIGSDGACTLAPEQEPPLLLPKYRGEDGKSSLEYEADMIASKPGTDVIVNGHAVAANGVPTTKMTVGLRIGGKLKALEVVGDRRFERDVGGQIVPSYPAPFLKMPVVYERAHGGYDAEDPDPARQKLFAPNPVGTGVVANRSRLIGKLAPNVSIPGSTASDVAAGFGAVCSYWTPRIDYGGTYDAKWLTDRKPLLPVDFDPRFFMCAPADQQFIPHLRGGERIEVAGMSATGALAFDLPKIALGFETIIDGKGGTYHKAFLQTVIVEPDHPRVVMVWQTQLRCHHEADFLDETIIDEKEYLS